MKFIRYACQRPIHCMRWTGRHRYIGKASNLFLAYIFYQNTPLRLMDPVYLQEVISAIVEAQCQGLGAPANRISLGPELPTISLKV